MPILVCAATDLERAAWPGPMEGWLALTTGVGCVATLLSLAKVGPIDAVVSMGIAGAYLGRGLDIGDVVLAGSEVIGDLGMEIPDRGRFIPLGETEFGGPDSRVLSTCVPAPWRDRFRVVPACTVSCCTGTAATGVFRRDRFDVAVETMEGAACAAFARDRGVPFVEVRAISNFASERDMRPANIRIALEALATTLESTVPALAAVPVARW
ncbi:MAG: hypothetical protein ACKO5K_11765 [Armatimonadota bacterium]